MFSGYKVVKETLYLYVDYKCEIGDIFSKDNNTSLICNIKEYIKKYKIKFNGTKVVLLLSGLLLATVYLNSNKNEEYNVYKDSKYVYSIVDKNVPSFKVKDENKGQNQMQDLEETNLNNVAKKEIKEVKQNYNSKAKEVKQNTNIEKSNTVETKKIEVNSTSQNIQSESTVMITVKRKNGSVITLSIDEYLIGVVGAEMPASFNSEALKAQAVSSRTYTLKLLQKNRVITDDINIQNYKSNDELRSIWGNSYNTYYNKIKDAVYSTKNLCIKYNGDLIDAVYHSTSNGYTEDPINVWGYSIPYLKTVTSPWDTSASSYLRSNVIDYSTLSNLLDIDFNKETKVEVLSRNDSNRISKIMIEGVIYTGVELRNILGLRSSDFDIIMLDNGVNFTTRGYGHGVGLSQYGANSMANSGYTYEQILKHYYTGIKIEKII